MDELKALKKIASELDRLGYFEQADELEEVLKSAALAAKVAATVAIDVSENPAQNEWVAKSADHKLYVSSPIYPSDPNAPTPEQRAQGADLMRKTLAGEVAKAYPGVHVQYTGVPIK